MRIDMMDETALVKCTTAAKEFGKALRKAKRMNRERAYLVWCNDKRRAIRGLLAGGERQRPTAKDIRKALGRLRNDLTKMHKKQLQREVKQAFTRGKNTKSFPPCFGWQNFTFDSSIMHGQWRHTESDPGYWLRGYRNRFTKVTPMPEW